MGDGAQCGDAESGKVVDAVIGEDCSKTFSGKVGHFIPNKCSICLGWVMGAPGHLLVTKGERPRGILSNHGNTIVLHAMQQCVGVVPRRAGERTGLAWYKQTPPRKGRHQNKHRQNTQAYLVDPRRPEQWRQ